MVPLSFTSKDNFLKSFSFKKKIQSSIQYISITCCILEFSLMKKNFNNLTINKLLNTSINDSRNNQKGLSFVGMERAVKKVATGSFNIFIAVENWIKGVLEVMFKFIFLRMT